MRYMLLPGIILPSAACLLFKLSLDCVFLSISTVTVGAFADFRLASRSVRCAFWHVAEVAGCVSVNWVNNLGAKPT